jgi:hypothetical protein
VHKKYAFKFQLKPDTWVFVPTAESVAYGQKIKFAIEKVWTPPSYYFHLKSGGHVEALKSHLHNNIFIHLDIESFFSSISRTRVTRCLMNYFSYKAARDIAHASTVPSIEQPGVGHPILPFGFVQSPIIASVCLQQSSLGRYLESLKSNPGFQVSVYVDDIVISTSNAAMADEVLGMTKMMATKSRFKLNSGKEEGPSDKITAFNIELSQNSLVIKPSRLEQFAHSYHAADSEHQKQGILGYVSCVNEAQTAAITSFTVSPPG